MVMIHEEMHPELQKKLKFSFLVPNLGIFGPPRDEWRERQEDYLKFAFFDPSGAQNENLNLKILPT